MRDVFDFEKVSRKIDRCYFLREIELLVKAAKCGGSRRSWGGGFCGEPPSIEEGRKPSHGSVGCVGWVG
jgi:hypothetical protein